MHWRFWRMGHCSIEASQSADWDSIQKAAARYTPTCTYVCLFECWQMRICIYHYICIYIYVYPVKARLLGYILCSLHPSIRSFSLWITDRLITSRPHSWTHPCSTCELSVRNQNQVHPCIVIAAQVLSQCLYSESQSSAPRESRLREAQPKIRVYI